MFNRTRQLAENAIMLGIATVFLLLATYTLLGGLVLMIIPIPFILLARQRALRDMLFIIATFGLLSLIISGPFMILPAVMLATVGLVMGYLYQKKKTAIPAVLGGAGAMLLTIISFLVISIYGLNVDIVGQLKQVITEVEAMPIPSLPANMTEAQYRDFIEKNFEMMISLFPASIMMTSFMVSGLNHWMSRIITKRLGSPIPALKPFREWSLPRSLIYYYFLTLLFMMLFYQSVSGTFYGKAILNLRFVLEILFTIQGLSFCFFWFHIKGWNKFTWLLIVFIFTPLNTILSLLGIFDLGIGLRNRIERRM
ncbi:YybS family protein [Brevibacillus ginsengisoli]|uniref:YybS family protein n=1 Tax=Brevibacillus ginsengisoli TaxID=363854 RepID=UPI003CF10AA8